jgi:class 3 adenylate cyclase
MTLVIIVVALLAGGGIVGNILWRRRQAERKEAARVRATFARYVAPSVVDILLARKDERLFTGRAVRATILVCRIREFARFVEDLSPEQTLRYLNEFYGLAGTAVQRHRGIITSLLGDGIVAVWGVPIDNPTQEEDAIKAGLDIVRHVVAMRDRWQKQGRAPFTVGIGINTGEVIAGDAGFRDRREFTVVGAEANFAHRLQEAAFTLNAFVLASRATCAPLDDGEFILVPMTNIPLPGVRRLLDAFVVRGRHRGQERFTVPTDALVETQIEPRASAPKRRAAASASASAAPAETAPIATPPPAPGPRQLTGGTSRPIMPNDAPKHGEADPPPVAKRRARRAAEKPEGRADFGVPELRESNAWRFGDETDVGAIFPDPPAPAAHYEDGSGPPLRL